MNQPPAHSPAHGPAVPAGAPVTAPAASARCPECDGAVVFNRPPLTGQVVSCAGCAAELEVTSREPLRLELAPEVEEDWGE